MKRTSFYKMIANIQDASAEESAEIINELSRLSDDDFTIVNTKKIEL